MKQIVVLGGGISGYGSAILAKKKGFGVFLSDAGRIADRYKAKLDEWEVPYEEGGHTEERILAATEVVKSPGIPDTAPMVRKIREAGIPVISEMEFAGVVPEVVSTDSLEAAMTASKAAARPGDAVLLSPACASFDLFRNYENRGELFKNWVEEKA